MENDAGRTAMDNITRADPSRTWTVREGAQHVALGGIGPVVAGTPAQVADALEALDGRDGCRRFQPRLCADAR